MRTLGVFDFRNNAIGFLRFFFAGGVFLCHAIGLGGFGTDFLTLVGSRLSSAYLAVAGFFVISGFLITRSFDTSGNGARFLLHRVLRIIPGFWVCLVVVAFGFAPIAYLHQHGTLRGFLSISPNPLAYITQNALLQINQISIGTLLAQFA